MYHIVSHIKLIWKLVRIIIFHSFPIGLIHKAVRLEVEEEDLIINKVYEDLIINKVYFEQEVVVVC